MNKTIITAVIVIALVVFAFVFARSCGLGEKYKRLKADYVEAVKIAEADHAMSMAHVEELNNTVSQLNNKIVGLQSEVAAKQNTISNLSTRLDELIQAEPSYPEMESHPLVINLRAQISKLSEMYSLSQQVITTQAEQIELYVGKYNAQLSISEEWKEGYEREHELRIQAEGLFKVAERKAKANSLMSKVATVGVAVAGVVIASQLLK